MKKKRRKIKTLDAFLKEQGSESRDDEYSKVGGLQEKNIDVKGIEEEVDELFKQFMILAKKGEKPIEENVSRETVQEKLVEVEKSARRKQRAISHGSIQLMDMFFTKRGDAGKPKKETSGKTVPKIMEEEGLESSKDTRELAQKITTRSNIIRKELLEKLLKIPVGPERTVSCTNTGECSDGKKLSEVFVDKLGILRQRGFIRTSRIPIVLDWVVERGRVEKVLPKAYKLVTERGAMALVPEGFICELVTRYGVLIDNYECKDFTLSLMLGNTVKKKR